jgi:predicted nucleotidyltransferase
MNQKDGDLWDATGGQNVISTFAQRARDLRGAHVLPLESVVGLDVRDETVEDSRVIEALEMDIVSHDVRKFFGLLLKKNGYVLEQLFSSLIGDAAVTLPRDSMILSSHDFVSRLPPQQRPGQNYSGSTRRCHAVIMRSPSFAACITMSAPHSCRVSFHVSSGLPPIRSVISGIQEELHATHVNVYARHCGRRRCAHYPRHRAQGGYIHTGRTARRLTR